MKLSVIIPCFNVSNYIEACLKSVFSIPLSEEEMEVIAVNDGSKDDTLQKLEQIDAPNFRLISQENQGLSGARNKGVSQAKGEYIMFVDSDDEVIPQSVVGLIRLADDHKTDICFGRLIQSKGDIERIINIQDFDSDRAFSGKYAIINNYHPCSVCGALYSLKFLNEENLRFYPRIYHQDVEFNFRAVTKAPRVLFGSISAYKYYIRPNSITTSTCSEKVIKRLVDDIIIASHFKEFAQSYRKEMHLYSTITGRSNSIVRGVIYGLKREQDHIDYAKIRKSVLSAIKDSGLMPLKEYFIPIKKWAWTQWINFKFLLLLKACKK